MAYYGAMSNYAAGDNYGRLGNYPYAAGGLFSSIGRAIGGAVRAVTGVASAVLPGPAGAVAGAINRIAGGGTASLPATSLVPLPQSVPVTRTPGVGGLISRILPGGDTGYEVDLGQLPNIGGCPTGYHRNKSGYFLKSGQYVPKGSVCVKNRSMNVANGRALRRGLRRVAGFGKLARRARRDIGRAATAVGVRRGARKVARRR